MKRFALPQFTLCSLFALSMLLAACSRAPSSPTLDVDAALAQCDRQVHRALQQLRQAGGGAIDTTMMPRNVAPGDSAWSCRPLCAEEWCSGFWPGILWLDYEAALLTGSDEAAAAEVKRAAIDATRAMHRIVDRPVFDHDLGFLIFCSAGTGLRVLEQELQRPDLPQQQRAEDEAAVACFRDLCLRAADSLATLFRPNVGTILSWPRNTQMFGGHNTIMDNMINLEMLCWAARDRATPAATDKNGQTSSQPEKNGQTWSLPEESPLFQIALRHAETTMRHHFRPDATSYHVAVYDTLDGHFIHGVTHQGLADSSMWARGQAWAVYGFTMMARETRDTHSAPSSSMLSLCDNSPTPSLHTAFLDMACRAVDAFIERLPADGVPFWDFNDPRIATSPQDRPEQPSQTVAPRDASAAAVVASALVELSTLLDDADRAEHYLATARRMLTSLAADHYQAAPASSAFLLHSTGNHPKQSEVDIPIIYADYYYIEALLRLKRLEGPSH